MSIADPDAAVQGYVRAATTSGHYNICYDTMPFNKV